MIRTLLVVVFVCCVSLLRLPAQCIDSSHVQYGAYCDPQWEPVCGCNGITYQNDCYSRNAGLTTWFYGICDEVDFSFTPNPPYDHIDVDAMLKTQGTMYVQLFDRFGNLFYVNAFPNVTRIQFQLDTRGLPTGIYYLNIFCDTGNRVKKVLVPGVI